MKSKRTKKNWKSSSTLLVTSIIFVGLVITVALVVTKQQLSFLASAQTVSCNLTVSSGASINSVINSASSGQTICVQPGTYRENVNIPRSKTGLKLISPTKWGAKIVGTKTNTERVAAVEINADNVTVSGFDVTGPDIKLGIADEGANNLITQNYIHDIAMTTPCDDWGGAAIEHGVYRSTNNNGASVGNYIDKVSFGQNCEYNQGIYHSQPTGKIINNIVKNVDAFCIHLWHGAKTNYQIYNNLVSNCGKAPGTSGITIGAAPSEGGSVTNSVIANNIILNSNRGIEENNASNNYYYNNINFNVPRDQLDVSCNSTRCSGNQSIDPKLDANYSPLPGSPVINNGYKPNSPTTDYNSNTRDSNPDIGPIEYLSSTLPSPTQTNKPLPSLTPRPSNTLTPNPTATRTPTSTPRSPTPTQIANPTSTPTLSTSWTFCANENQYCSFTGTRTVRYGASQTGNYIYKDFTNGVNCNNANFGDPAVGWNKTCHISGATASPTATITPIPPTNTPQVSTSPCSVTGSVIREVWRSVKGDSLSAVNWSSSPSFTSSLSSLSAPGNWADDYATRIRGYLCPTITGTYTFYLASDNEGQFWLSSNSNPANKQLRVSVTAGQWTSEQEYTKYPNQKSQTINLSANQPYYFEIYQKEGWGGDNVSVAWSGPNISRRVIPGSALSKF